MKRTWIILFLTASVLGIVESASAQQEFQNRWWTRPGLVSRLGLTPQQQSSLDAAFERSRRDLVAIRDDVRRRTFELREELDRPRADGAAILKAGDRVSEARARLFRRELVMLTEMKGVLEPHQWEAVRRVLQPNPEGRPHNRPGPRRRPPG